MAADHENQAGTPARLFKGIRENITTEQEQAFMRLLLGLVVFAYLFLAISFSQTSSNTLQNVIWLSGTFMLYAIILVFMTMARPKPSKIRRSFSMLTDFCVISTGMYLANETGAALYTILLWSVFGYGIRYGRNYLIAASLLGMAGFIVVITTTPFWLKHPALSVGLLAGLVVLPVFIYSLLDSLKREKRKAYNASLAKDRFIANMSHEMRTPLNGIIGMSEMLEKSKLDSDQLELSNTIQASAQTLLNIVEDVLDISKLESGELTTNKVKFNLHNLVTSVTKVFGEQAINKGLRLETEISAGTHFNLKGDAHHLRQVLINLIGNAIKFTDKGFVRIIVSTKWENQQNSLIQFDITDSGIGIPFEQQHAIFESFNQADNSLTRRYGGVGLGTTISKKLLDLMGGDISFKSIPGCGTTFTLEIPFTHVPDTRQDESPHDNGVSSPHPRAENYKLQGSLESKILVVTANKGTSESLGYYLAVWGMDAHYAENAAEAFSRLIDASQEKQYFDFLILEQSGIDIDAIQFSHAIDGEDSIHRPELILIQPSKHKHGEKQFLNNGYRATLSLPVNEHELLPLLSSKQYQADKAPLIHHEIHEETAGYSDKKDQRRVLVVEDNRVSQRVIERILEHNDIDFIITNNGAEALELLKKEHFDIGIIDLHMPDMSGIELAKAHLSTNDEQHVPLIVLTANITGGAEQACYDAGFSGYLTKPVTSQRLLSAMDTVISGGMICSSDPGNYPDNESGVLDRESLGELVTLDAGNGFLLRLCKSFEEDSEALLDNIRNEIDSSDTNYIQELIHALKGSAGNVGANEFHNRCAYYCDMSENEFLDNQQELLTDLHKHFTEARHALREFIEEYNAVAS